MVPRIVAKVAESTPTRAVTQAASMRLWLRNSSPYHLVEKPAQTVTSLDSLNEKMMSSTIGR